MFLVLKTLQKKNLGLSGSSKYKARKVGIWAHDQKCAHFGASCGPKGLKMSKVKF